MFLHPRGAPQDLGFCLSCIHAIQQHDEDIGIRVNTLVLLSLLI